MIHVFPLENMGIEKIDIAALYNQLERNLKRKKVI